jgi:phage recombination protein Bet
MADQQLPALRSSRLPWHPVFEEYGIDRTDWQALVEAVFPGAQSLDSIRLALSYCKRRNLDPFKRPIHIVPIWDSEQRKFVDTIWPGIAELRTTAFRTGQYAGAEAAQFGEIVENEWQDGNAVVRLTYPAWAQLTVYRLVGGQRVPVPGPRVYWMETYSSKGRSDVPNDRWRRAPFQMLEKCAEAAALRRAFPEELGDLHSDEEIGATIRDVSPPPIQETPQESASSSGTGNEALRSRLQRQSPPDNAAGTPAPESLPEAPREDSPSPVEPPEDTSDITAIKPMRKRGGGWDWPRYADDIITAARALPADQLQEYRVKNATMLDVLRSSDHEQWSRVQQALAEHESAS